MPMSAEAKWQLGSKVKNYLQDASKGKTMRINIAEFIVQLGCKNRSCRYQQHIVLIKLNSTSFI